MRVRISRQHHVGRLCVAGFALLMALGASHRTAQAQIGYWGQDPDGLGAQPAYGMPAPPSAVWGVAGAMQRTPSAAFNGIRPTVQPGAPYGGPAGSRYPAWKVVAQYGADRSILVPYYTRAQRGISNQVIVPNDELPYWGAAPQDGFIGYTLDVYPHAAGPRW